jgi:hypothetical protein
MTARSVGTASVSAASTRRAALLLGLATLLGCGGPADSDGLRRCREQAERFGAALKTEDWSAFVNLTYAPHVAKLGGKSKAVAALRANAKKERFRVERLAVKQPDRLIVAAGDALAILPVELELRVGDTRLAGSSFFLGISSDQGRTWSFLDGYGLDRQTVKSVIPHFPPGVDLPEQAIVEKKGS